MFSRYQRHSDHYDPLGELPTGPMGMNLMLVNPLNRLYIPVSPAGNAGAKIRVYSIQ